EEPALDPDEHHEERQSQDGEPRRKPERPGEPGEQAIQVEVMDAVKHDVVGAVEIAYLVGRRHAGDPVRHRHAELLPKHEGAEDKWALEEMNRDADHARQEKHLQMPALETDDPKSREKGPAEQHADEYRRHFVKRTEQDRRQGKIVMMTLTSLIVCVQC